MEVYADFWLGAIVLTLFGTTLSSVGLLIQKYSHSLLSAAEEDAEKLHSAHDDNWKTQQETPCQWYFLSSYWVLGMGVFMLGQVICWGASAFGVQVVLSCLSPWSIVVSFVLAPLVFRETISANKIVGVAIIICGVVLVTMFGPRTYRKYTADTLMNDLQNRVFLVFTCFTIMVVAALCAKAFYSSKRPRLSAAEFTMLAAMSSWYSVLCAKASASLILSSLRYEENQFEHPICWAVLLGLCILGPVDVHLLNMALKYGQVMFVVPVNQALSILGQVILNGAFYGEFQALATEGIWSRLNFWVGVLSVIVGVVCMTSHPSPLLSKHLGVPEGQRSTSQTASYSSI